MVLQTVERLEGTVNKPEDRGRCTNKVPPAVWVVMGRVRGAAHLLAMNQRASYAVCTPELSPLSSHCQLHPLKLWPTDWTMLQGVYSLRAMPHNTQLIVTFNKGWLPTVQPEPGGQMRLGWVSGCKPVPAGPNWGKMNRWSERRRQAGSNPGGTINQ